MQAIYPTGVMILVDTRRRQVASDLIEAQRLTTLRYPSVEVGTICTATDNRAEFQGSSTLWSPGGQERGSMVEEK